MKDRDHDDAMAELFRRDPGFAVALWDDVSKDGISGEVEVAARQLRKAGIFDRTGVRYEVACDLLGALLSHYAEALAKERGKPAPDTVVVGRIEAAQLSLRLEREALDPADPEAIQAIIRKHGHQARELYSRA